MKRVINLFVMCLALSSMLFVSCKKDDVNGNSDAKAVCHFNATVQMSEEFITACESITFEYKDASGKIVSAKVDASKLKAAVYTVPATEEKIDVLEWNCKFDYNNCPAEVYFKPIVKVKETLSFESKPSFVFNPVIVSGVYPSKLVTNYNKAEVKLRIRLDGVTTILNNLADTINGIKVDTTIEK